MKVAVIGGGSTYTPELVSGLLAFHASLPTSELWLMDIDAERLEIVGGFAKRIVASQGQPFNVFLTDDRRQAIQGANFIITQIRVGGMAARREDEYLGRRHGLIGQETTGVGGMSKALRTIPVILKIAQEVEELSPGAVLANFTNPAGLITEAVTRNVPEIVSVGVCNVPITATMDMLRLLDEKQNLHLDPQETCLDTLGLNHLSWHRGLHVGERDYWPQVMEATLEALYDRPEPDWPPQLIQEWGMLPNYYLAYYYNTKNKLEAQASWPPSRAEEVMEIEAALLRKYADPSLIEMPEELMQRGGAYYSTMAARLLNAIHNDLEEVHVLNVPHRSAVSEWPEDWVLELPCRVDQHGAHPLPAEPLPSSCFELLAQVKASELLTVEAAVHADRSALYQALDAHPLGPDPNTIEAVLEDMLETHREYLPQFWNKPPGE
jgi:6-phospho-beta-glucosidase